MNDLTEALLNTYKELGGISHVSGYHLPSRKRVFDCIKQLRYVLFPGFFEQEEISQGNLRAVTLSRLDLLQTLLSDEIYRSLLCGKTGDEDTCRKQSDEHASALLHFLPALRGLLMKDMMAIYEGDPAAKTKEEIVIAYPGFQAIVVYRLAHFLHCREIPFLPRVMTEISHSETGIDIHPGATIGHSFFIDHGTGIVIGETAIIGDYVKLYQGVTLGAMSVKDRSSTHERHPIIKDHVTIYARTTVLGRITLGEGAVIGGNVWLTDDVAPGSKIYNR